MHDYQKMAALKKAAVFTLIVAPEGRNRFIGSSAFSGDGWNEPQGSLSQAPFWPAHWARLRQMALAENDLSLSPEDGFRYLAQKIGPGDRALILGGGHVGQALAKLLLFLGYEVFLLDDRPEFARYFSQYGEGAPEKFRAGCLSFDLLERALENEDFSAAIIVTRGHFSDLKVLRPILDMERRPPYVGMIGSSRRAAQCLKLLADEGYSKEILESVHSPVGLAIGAETPEEIAVSIAGQIIESRREKNKQMK